MILGRLGREQERSGRGWFRWGATQVALVSVLGLAGCGGDGAEGGDPCSQERTGDNEPVDSFCVSGTIEPAWADSDPLPPVSIDSAQDQSPRLAVYLDVSSPMSGFVPPPGMESDSGSVPGGELRPVAQWIPDQLVRAYPGVPIQWYSVAEAVEQMGQRPIIQRDIFTGTQSRLNLAVDSILTHLRTGRSEGAAIITDLMGTGELIGALAVAQYLIPWLASEERRGNDFRFALIGVRGTYWGAFPSYCPRQGGPLGCWFSESIGDWKPRLKRPVVSAVLCLVVRTQRRGAQRDSPVDYAGRCQLGHRDGLGALHSDGHRAARREHRVLCLPGGRAVWRPAVYAGAQRRRHL